MDKRNSVLCQEIVLYTHYLNFQFSIIIYFTNQITLKQNLAQRLKIIFKFNWIKTLIKAEEKIEKIFWGVLLHFSSYRSIKI